MKKTIVLLALTFLGFNSFCQKKDTTTNNKPIEAKLAPPNSFSVTLSTEQWQYVMNAIQKLPFDVASTIITVIQNSYNNASTSTKK